MKVLMFRNGNWTSSYHDNFYINEAKHHGISLSDVEKSLKEGLAVFCGAHYFKKLEKF